MCIRDSFTTLYKERKRMSTKSNSDDFDKQEVRRKTYKDYKNSTRFLSLVQQLSKWLKLKKITMKSNYKLRI